MFSEHFAHSQQVQRSLVGRRNVSPNLVRRLNEYWISSLHALRRIAHQVHCQGDKKIVKPNRLLSFAFALEIRTARSMITSRTRKNRPKMDKIFIMVLVPWLFASADAKYSCACQRRIHYAAIRLMCAFSFLLSNKVHMNLIFLHISFMYSIQHTDASPMSHTTHANRQTDTISINISSIVVCQWFVW